MGLPSQIILRGTRAAQPTPTAGGAGFLYYVTDESKLERWSGTAWEQYSISPTGAIPGGSNTQVQYNNASAFGGITGATTNGTTLTLVAPVLGTPASGTLTNCAGLPVAGLTDSALTIAARTANSAGTLSALSISDGQTAKRVGTSITSARFGPASVSVLTSGSGATYTVPAGIYRLYVRLVGCGGGGGGSDGTTSGVSAGGSAGGYCEKMYSTTPGATFTYTVVNAGGAGGTAGNNSGTTGSDTVFDSGGTPVTGAGGGGGGSMATGSTFAAAIPTGGGAATGGDINIAGGAANNALRMGTSIFCLSTGAGSPLGWGGTSGVNGTGGTATGYGAGGGGTCSSSGVADQAGGPGGPGVIIVEEYN